ncbi:MAG: hypothetical protein LBE80_04555, partial [Deltaproteobacteria bacterium]|nr:hypothetical protein [Deltaproteobacteria bacterium]
MTEVNLPFPTALWDDLSLVDPQKAAQNSGSSFEDGRFNIEFLRAPYVVDVKQRLVLGPPNRLRTDFQRALVLV